MALKIGLVIGALGFGGAETQLICLAKGLSEAGHQVSLLCYDGKSTRDHVLNSTQIKLIHGTGGSRKQKINVYRNWVEEFRPDVVHASMKRASMLALIGKKSGDRFPVIASDFSTATYNRRSPSLWLALAIFKRANAVVTETRLNERNLQRLAPWLRKKTVVIRNGIDMTAFNIASHKPEKRPFRFAAIGSVYGVKNPVATVKAAGILSERVGREFKIDWYGRKGLKGDAHPSSEYLESIKEIEKLGIRDCFEFHGETNPITPAYHNAHALLHPSLKEGVPNAVVEGMACGLPIAVSRVSDLPLIVENANNGFTFNERDPESIADALRKFLVLDNREIDAMGKRSRKLAIDWFDLERFITEHENLYLRLLES